MYKLIAILLGLILFISCQSGDKTNNKTDEVKTEIVMVKDTLNISGMHCDMCVSSIEKGINELDGIKYVKASLSDSVAVVSFDESLTNLAEIKNAIKKRGYEVKGDL